MTGSRQHHNNNNKFFRLLLVTILKIDYSQAFSVLSSSPVIHSYNNNVRGNTNNINIQCHELSIHNKDKDATTERTKLFMKKSTTDPSLRSSRLTITTTTTTSTTAPIAKSTAPIYASTSSLDQQSSQSLSLSSILFFLKSTVQPIVIFVLHSFLFALLYIGVWETYACTHLWPSRAIRANSVLLSPSSPSSSSPSLPFSLYPTTTPLTTIHGMAFGKDQRLQLLKQFREEQEQEQENVQRNKKKSNSKVAAALTDNEYMNNDNNKMLLARLPSYNEAMEQHRDQRVARWIQIQKGNHYGGRSSNTAINSMKQQPNEEEIETAVGTIFQSIQVVFRIKELAKEYEWDKMHTFFNIYHPSVFMNNGDGAIATSSNTNNNNNNNPLVHLEQAATTLRVHLLERSRSNNQNSHGHRYSTSTVQQTEAVAAQEIGFDWGSCAWRHCGALADAQEAIDELDYMVGVLEPYECLFVIDVLERSLRDIWAVIPESYKYDNKNVYLSLPKYEPYKSSSPTSVQGEEESYYDKFDADYLRVLKEIRQ